ncbi:H-NS family nucleoid-associated regulatory protein [Paraburkholderia sediminicola]|uniref:H-NS family nucleoid-associated regulatory protein n=1 Tax=Paraburkholderia sediminicola TaxID=458836 RepID=UPI0038BADCC0
MRPLPRGQPKGPQPAKYADPKSGATWCGPGPAPAWLADVKDRSKFLIGGAPLGTKEAAFVGKANTPKAAGKSGVIVKKTATPPAKKAVAKKR